MDAKLKKNVELLLVNANIKHTKNSSNYTLTDEAMETRGVFDDSSIHGIVDYNPEDWQLHNEHALILIKLSNQLSEKETTSLDSLLLSKIIKNSPAGVVDAITLYFIHSNKLGILLKHIKKTLTGYNNQGAVLETIDCLTQSMKHRPDIFGSDGVGKLSDYANDYMKSKSKLGKDADQYSSLYTGVTNALRGLYITTNEILTRKFARQIDTAFNPELNIDEEKVIEQIEAIGFPLDLSQSLSHISDLIEQANDPLRYRDVMSAIRVFTERFYEQVAKAIEPTTKTNGKDAGEVAKLFKSKKLLSTDMADLLKSHRHFLSNDGTHRIKSRKEDARIAKNMTIELALYIITRLRELQDANND